VSSELCSHPGPPCGRLPDPGWLGELGRYDGVVHVLVVLLPAAVLAVWSLAGRRRRSGSAAALAWRLSLAEVGIVYLTVPAVWITVLPGPQAGHVPARASLVPLRDLATMSTFQIVGNLLLLAALGFLSPVRFAAASSLPRVLVLAASFSAAIETSQYLLPLDRVASIDDLLLNTVGAGLAALVSRPWWRARRSRNLQSLAGTAGRRGLARTTERT
jgi:glycopeptide antibiotics resistance protein